MEITNANLAGLLIIKPTVFEDDRGYFYESFNQADFNRKGITENFVQDNQSLSQKDVLRGLHFQSPPYSQGKLVRVIKGAVLDVAVDIRKNSVTFGKHFDIILDEKNRTMLWIPVGFAHGFLTLENNTIFSYKCSNYYNKLSEGCILWDDQDIRINWNVSHPILSDKDKLGVALKDFRSPF